MTNDSGLVKHSSNKRKEIKHLLYLVNFVTVVFIIKNIDNKIIIIIKL